MTNNAVVFDGVVGHCALLSISTDMPDHSRRSALRAGVSNDEGTLDEHSS